MKILVIGNGFDLEHGLPTKYKDFLDFVKTIREIFINEWFSKDRKEYFCWISGPNGINDNLKKYFLKHNFLNELKNSTSIKEIIELSKDNIWIKYFLENIEYENQGWIDFESEISHVIQSFEQEKYISEYFKIYGKFLEDIEGSKEEIVRKIIEYSGLNIKIYMLVDNNLHSIITLLNEHLNSLIRCLEIYLEDCVGKIEVEYIAPDIKDIKLDKVLSFNYTNTYDKIYGFNNNEIEYHYIHGKADITRTADDNNMVLGIDEYLDDEAKNKQLEFIAFKKYFQRIYQKTGNEYKKWILKIENFEYETVGECDELGQYETQKIRNEIYIFGHSLDITDKDIIKELIECPNTETTIFYYDKDVYAQQIANMVKIIGQDELIKRVSGADPTIIFKQQQQRIKRY